MRKLVFILLAFLAVVTFIRAYENSAVPDTEYSQAMINVFPDR